MYCYVATWWNLLSFKI